MMFAVFLVLTCHALAADTASLPTAPTGPRAWLRQHRGLLEQAAKLQQQQPAGAAEQQQPAGAAEQQSQPLVTWRRLWQELMDTQQFKYVAPASALSLGLTASELIAPRLRGQLFDAALLPGATLAAMVPNLQTLALLALAGWVLNILSSILFARARWSSAMANRVRLMDSLLAQEPAFFDGQAPGELSSRLLTEPERLEALANRGPERALAALLSSGGALLLMLSLDWRLALVAVGLRAPLVGKLAEAAGRTVGLLGVLQQRALTRANALASEVLAHPHAVAAHGATDRVSRAYAGRCEEYMAVIRATLVSETVLRFTRLGVDSLTSLLLLGFGLLAVLRGKLSLGALTAFYAYADQFADGSQKLQELLHDVYTVRPACARYFALLDRTPRMAWRGKAANKEARSPAGAGAAAARAAAAAGGGTAPNTEAEPKDGEAEGGTEHSFAPAGCEGALEVSNVSIRFDGRSEAALRNVSLSIRPGETLALVGPSGAGKSTLIKLLNRLYDPDDGAVRLDGRDLRSLDLQWLRTRFGVVPQQPALFDMSIAENVAFGTLDGTPTAEDVQRALDASGASEFVRRLPEGSETIIGENGHRLSGGQRQRLAVARALVRQPAVLLWDEATSSLDGASERLVHAALAEQGRGRTAVVVAHRLSSVLCADRVAVLIGGRLVQLGTPEELAAADGWYRSNFFPDPATAPALVEN